jgi:hypothetical protein
MVGKKDSKQGMLGHKMVLGFTSLIFVCAKNMKAVTNFVKVLNKTPQLKLVKKSIR